MEEEKLKLTDIVGSNGRYQVILLVLLFLMGAYAGVAGVLVQLVCPNVIMFWDWDESSPNRTTFHSSHCKMEDILNLNSTSSFSNSSSKLIYYSSYSRKTLSEELGLVCERSWLVSLANSLIIVGGFLGSLFISRLSEIYGRKACTLWTMVAFILCNFGILFSKEYILFSVLCFISGATRGHSGVFILLEAIEIVPKSRISSLGTISTYGLLIGQIVFVGVAWLIQDWFQIQLFLSLFIATYLVFGWYQLESPVWLAVRGKYEESRKTVFKIIERNRRKPDDATKMTDLWLEHMKFRCQIQSKAEAGRYSDLFKNREIAFYTCAMSFIMISNSIILNGIVINAESFGSGLYLDMTISNVFSVASLFLANCFLTKFSIRNMVIVGFILQCVICATYPIFYEIPVARTTLSVLTKCCISSLSCLVSIYINEIFPTSVRGISNGFCITVSKVFSVISPFTKELKGSQFRSS